MKLALAFVAVACAGYFIGHRAGVGDGIRSAPEFIAKEEARKAEADAIRLADMKAKNAGPNRYDLCDQFVTDMQMMSEREAADLQVIEDGWNAGRSRWGE